MILFSVAVRSNHLTLAFTIEVIDIILRISNRAVPFWQSYGLPCLLRGLCRTASQAIALKHVDEMSIALKVVPGALVVVRECTSLGLPK